jgi:hypothetical protein
MAGKKARRRVGGALGVKVADDVEQGETEVLIDDIEK